MVSGCDFPRKAPESEAWRSNRIQGIGARGRFLTQKTEGVPERIKKHKENKWFRAAIFHIV